MKKLLLRRTLQQFDYLPGFKQPGTLQ